MELKKISKQLMDKKREYEQLHTKALFHEDFKVFCEFAERCCQQLVESQEEIVTDLQHEQNHFNLMTRRFDTWQNALQSKGVFNSTR